MKSVKMLRILVMALAMMVWLVGPVEAGPMGTAWTYQGRLMDANSAADGQYDFEFKLFDYYSKGVQQGNTIEVNDLDVIDGYFTAELDFGSNVFNGDARWLETTVAQSDGSDPCTLRPRIEITPVPYALQTRGIFVNDILNVGIGTKDPDCRLHVNMGHGYVKFGGLTQGDIFHGHFDGGGEGAGVEASLADGSTAAYLAYDSQSGPFAGYFQGDVYVSGNVGIGITKPTEALEVAGTVAAIAFVGDGSGLTGMPTDTDWTESGGDIYRETGNVGIGTTSPTGALDVRGDGVRIWDGTATVDYATGHGDLYVESELEVDGDIYVGQYIYHEGDLDTLVSFVDNRLRFYAGNQFLLDLSEGTQDYVKLGNGSDVDIDLNGCMFVEGSSGGVGIGTTSPTGALDIRFDEVRIWDGTATVNYATDQSDLYVEDDLEVDGTIYGNEVYGNPLYTTGYLTHTGDIDTRLYYTDDRLRAYIGGEYLLDLSESGQDYVKLGDGGDVDIDLNDDLFIQGSSGNVGIGTEVPDVQLHVKGTQPQIAIDTTSNNAGLLYKDNGATKWDIGYSPGDDYLYFYDFDGAGTSMVLEDTTGNVGIGTNNPIAKLQVTDDYVHIGNSGLTPHCDGDGDLYVEDTLEVGGAIWMDNIEFSSSGPYVRWYLGRFYLDSSSAKYKDEIQPLTDDFSKILDVNPKSFIDKPTGQRNIGFIAEELDQLGLKNLVNYKDSQPAGIKYEMVPLYMLEVLKEQVETTEQVRKENESLKNRLEALEKTVQQIVKAKEVQL